MTLLQKQLREITVWRRRLLLNINSIFLFKRILTLSSNVSQIYKRRNPEVTVLYQLVQDYFEDWYGNYILKHGEVLPRYVEAEFRAYFKCGILAYGIARAYCASCRADFVVAFSCKKRGVCPSCSTKHMHSITAHLVENVLPKLPMRQWVLSVPKWIRYFIARESKLLSKVLRIFVNEIEKQLKKSSVGIEREARLGAVSFYLTVLRN